MNLEDFDIWWSTVRDEIEDAIGVTVPDRDAHCFVSAHAAGRCAYEVARAYVEDIREGETL